MADFTTVAIFPTFMEKSHFPVSKQMVKVQFLLDILGKKTCFTRGEQAIVNSCDSNTSRRLIGNCSFFPLIICFISEENEQFPMSVKFATRAEGECYSHRNWQSLVSHEWNALFFPSRLATVVTVVTLCFGAAKWLFSLQVGKIATVVKSAIFPSQNRQWKYNFHKTCWGNSYLF